MKKILFELIVVPVLFYPSISYFGTTMVVSQSVLMMKHIMKSASIIYWIWVNSEILLSEHLGTATKVLRKLSCLDRGGLTVIAFI